MSFLFLMTSLLLLVVLFLNPEIHFCFYFVFIFFVYSFTVLPAAVTVLVSFFKKNGIISSYFIVIRIKKLETLGGLLPFVEKVSEVSVSVVDRM